MNQHSPSNAKRVLILVIEMGDRGSKIIIFISVIVKEQRVDGSLIIITIIIRCTLVAGKAGLWKKLSNSKLKLSQ